MSEVEGMSVGIETTGPDGKTLKVGVAGDGLKRVGEMLRRKGFRPTVVRQMGDGSVRVVGDDPAGIRGAVEGETSNAEHRTSNTEGGEGPGPKLKRIAALRVLEVKDPAWLANMQGKAVPDVSVDAPEGVKALAGWCGRHPLDGTVEARGGEVNVGLCVLRREPPASLVKAIIEKELAAWARHNGRKAGELVKAEVKGRVCAVLSESAQWNLRENRVVLRPDLAAGDLVYTDATGDNQLDAVCLELSIAGLKVMPLSPEGMMLEMGGLKTADWAPPRWLGDKGTAGQEFLTWAAWRVIGAAEGEEPAWGINTPFLTGKNGSKEEVTAGGDASADELLRRSLEGGRRLMRMRLLAGPAELMLDAGARVCGLKWRHDEPESAYEAARVAWFSLELVFVRYAKERADFEAWAIASARIGAWIIGEFDLSS